MKQYLHTFDMYQYVSRTGCCTKCEVFYEITLDEMRKYRTVCEGGDIRISYVFLYGTRNGNIREEGIHML